jgi:tellurite resistance protein TehA-like permease
MPSASTTLLGDSSALEKAVQDGSHNPKKDSAKPEEYSAHDTRIARAYGYLHICSWSWSLMPMTTLGLSTLLSAQRSLHSFPGLYELGLVVYFIGLVQWIFILMVRSVNFISQRGSFTKSMSEPSEAMFFAAFWIGAYGIITAGAEFAAPIAGSHLGTTFCAFFWIYLVCALCTGVGLHLLLFQQHSLLAAHMTPAWLLPVLPIILVGVMAGGVADFLTEKQRFPVLIAGLVCSSMGFLISLPVAAIYFTRLFTAGFPDPDTRPGMMIAVGPPTYAPLAWLKLAAAIPKDYAAFATFSVATEVVQIMAFILSLAVFGMGIFFLLMAFCAIIRRSHQMRFHLTWYGFIFPNVGLLSAAGIFGNLIPSDGLKWVVSVATAFLSAIWIFVSVMHVRAIMQHSEFVKRT